MKRSLVLIALVLGCIGTLSAHSRSNEFQTNKKTFNVANGGTLEVSVSGGDIEITPSGKGEVTVRTEGDDEEGGGANVVQDGSTIRVTDGEESTGDTRYIIAVPSRFNLHLSTAYGDITVKGDVTGKVFCETSAGDIRVGDVDGTAELRTSGGDLRMGKVSGNATLTTSGGEIEVASSSGELDLHSSGGDLKVGNVGKSLRAKTAGGDVIIGNVGGEASVSTAGGNVSVGTVTGNATLSTAGGNVELRGGSGKIKASTSGGNMTLTNLSGSVTATTAGGDIEAELRPSGKGKSMLTSSAGMIKLFLPASAKATVEAHILVRGWWDDRDEQYEILSDFKADHSDRSQDDGEIRSTYVLNGGGETIRVETVNSNIEIRRLNK